MRAFPVERVTSETLKTALQQHVEAEARIMTDELPAYRRATEGFASHETVSHGSGEYVSGEAGVNVAEGFFSLLKRGINGTFHHVSKGHLGRYCDEFSFRYNLRTETDADRAVAAVQSAEGKRLTYKQPA